MIKIRSITKISFILTILLFLNSCASLFSSVDAPDKKPADKQESLDIATEGFSTTSRKTTRVPIEADPSEAHTTDEVEILWDVPTNNPEEFILQYGYKDDELENELILARKELEQVNDPGFGLVYRYIIQGIPKNVKIFVRLAEYHKGKEPVFSEIFEVAPL